MKINKDDMKKYMVLVAAMMIAGMVSAQEVEGFESAEIADSLIANVDTVEVDPDPEWYVAPLNYDSVMARHNAPRRAAAANYHIDSVLTYDVTGNLVEVAVYEYGDTTRTINWSVNPDGTRVGLSKEESGNINGTQFSATYNWNNTINNWEGALKLEYVYESGKMTSNTEFTWINNVWMPQVRYTYAYDNAGREIKFLTLTRNVLTNQLDSSNCRIREYTTNGKQILEIQYTAHDGTKWSAGTKKVWDYDNSGNQSEYVYYGSLSNGSWVGSSRELWIYTSGKKTYYEKQNCLNGEWIGFSKEIWTFEGNNQILHEKYGMSNGDWAISLREIKGYNESGNNNLVENYSLKNGVLAGTKKEEYVLSGKTKIETVTYKWTNGAWVKNVWTVNNTLSNPTDNCTYNWNGTTWVGTGTRTLQTKTAGKVTEKITQSWSTTLNSWENKTRNTTAYSGAKTTQEASYSWSAELNEWIGVSRSDWHYNTAGRNDTIKTYTPNGTEWIFSKRTVNTYNSRGDTLSSVKADWNGEDWVPTSINRGEYSYTESGKPLLFETYTGLEGNWRGVTKKEYTYDEKDRLLTYWEYEWRNGEWGKKNHTEQAFDVFDNQILNLSYSWTNNTWRGVYKYEYVYNGDSLLSKSQYTGTSSGWYGFSRTDYTYYSSGKEQSVISFSWNISDWVESQKTEYIYDEQGRTIDRKIYQYSNNAWKNNQWKTQGYDSRGQEVSVWDYRWVNEEWVVISRKDITYDQEDNKLRREINGSWSTSGVQNSYFDKIYYYNVDFPFYTIRFENYDGTLLESHSIQETKTPVYEGAKPSRPADAQYTYTFKGWTPAIVTVTGDATYTAEYDSVVNRYRITWLNADDVEVAVDSLEYGAMPSHEDVVKPSTSKWAYLFAGWSPAIVAVTGDATYKAQLDSVRNGYRITWLDVDDTELAADSLSYGAMPSHEYVLKANTAEWTYSFVGWTPEIVSVTADATYKAQIDSVRNRYRVTWLDADDTELAVDSLAYGATLSHEYVLKANTAEWTYSFVGWTPEIATVTGDATYKAQIDSVRNRYRITWLDADDVEVDVDSLAYGATPSHEDLVKTNTAEWTYSFVGWTPAITSVTGDATYKAQFDSVRNSYRVTWLDADDTELAVDSLAYGATPSREYVLKANTAEWTYSFVGWTPEIATVTGDATYKAQIDSVRNRYRITWLDANDTEIAVDSLAYGATPSREYVLKANTAEWTYSFVGWTPEIAAVSADATYKAQIDSVRNSYLITFKNGEDTLQSTLVAYGTMPVYGGETPTKQADAQYTYSFNGWDAELVEVTGETTYNATFSSTVNNYTITWLLDDGTKIDEESVAYGTTPSHTDAHKDNTAQYTITFVGWDKAFAAVTGDETYTAVFDSVVNSYTVIFYFEDGVTVLDSKEWKYGETPSTSLIPSLPATAKYTYTFAGWSPELQPVTGNAAYSPVFDSIVNTYTVTFVNYNDMVLQSSQVPYDDVPEYTGETPIKPSNVMYHYVFTGWTPELVAVTGDARYKAVYDQVLNRYTILFYDEDGLTILDSVEVDYGQMPETSVIPTKADDEEYTYTFAGWSPKIVSATRNTSYTATYTAKLKTEGLWDVEAAEKAQKVMIDGVIYIRRGGKIYTLDGTEVE